MSLNHTKKAIIQKGQTACPTKKEQYIHNLSDCHFPSSFCSPGSNQPVVPHSNFIQFNFASAPPIRSPRTECHARPTDTFAFARVHTQPTHPLDRPSIHPSIRTPIRSPKSPPQSHFLRCRKKRPKSRSLGRLDDDHVHPCYLPVCSREIYGQLRPVGWRGFCYAFDGLVMLGGDLLYGKVSRCLLWENEVAFARSVLRFGTNS